MSEFDGFRWKEAVAIVAAFVTVAGFLVTLWVQDGRQLDDRIRKLEIEQAKLWCAMNPETCMGKRDAP